MSAGEYQQVVALAGGVGASRLLRGLVRVIPPESLAVIVNTGDDIVLHGLHVSPDIDTVVYTMAGVADPERGWGLRDETWNALSVMGRYGMDTWFALGDKDLATHVFRTSRLAAGAGLATVTAEIARAWGVVPRILPMTEDRVENRVVVEEGGRELDLHFQEYLVHHGSPDSVLRAYAAGVNSAQALPEAIAAIEAANAIVFCPSNPVVSIGPILAVPGIGAAVRRSRARKIAVSPIVGGAPVRGPADRLMRSAGIDVSCVGIARHYAGIVDTLVIDERDREQAGDVATHCKCIVANTLISDLRASEALSRILCEAVDIRAPQE